MNKKIINISNSLTLLRLILSLVISYFIITKNTRMSLILLLIALSTDWIDGFLARRLKQKTRFGAIFDPIADATLISLVLLSLLIVDFSIVYIAILIIIPRTITAVLIRKIIGNYSATVYSKIAAFFIYVILFLLIFESNIFYTYLFILPVYTFSFMHWIRISSQQIH